MPAGFVPTQDKQYLVAFAQLPDGASIDRTDAVMRRMGEIGMKIPGIQDAVQFPGLSISGFSVAPNAGIIFFCLKPFEDRKTSDQSGPAIAEALNREFGAIKEAFVLTVIAFIAGVFPLVISSGAGAEMRHAMGVAVFSGMIGVTVFGLFLT